MKKINGVDWDEKGLVMSKNNVGNVFLLGCANYQNKSGETVAVFFTSENAFFFEDEVGNWSMSELRDEYVAKDSMLKGAEFPVAFDGYYPICYASNDNGFDSVGEPDMNVLARHELDIDAVAKDIKERLVSLESFRKEIDMLNQ